MLFTTHFLLGLSLAAAVKLVAPQYAAAGLAAVAGSILPDFDVLFQHRRTLHFPIASSILALFTAPFLIAAPNVVTASVFLFALGVALHCFTDLLCNGIGPDPWKHEWENAVYNHVEGEWMQPLRWIGYAGSRSDLFLLLVFAIPPVLVYGRRIQLLVAAALLISFTYVLIQEHVPRITPDTLLQLYRKRQDYDPAAEAYAENAM